MTSREQHELDIASSNYNAGNVRRVELVTRTTAELYQLLHPHEELSRDMLTERLTLTHEADSWVLDTHRKEDTKMSPLDIAHIRHKVKVSASLARMFEVWLLRNGYGCVLLHGVR